VDKNEIEANITSLKRGSTTWSNVEKYALLCIARDNLNSEEVPVQRQPPSYSYASAPDSEFTRAAREADFETLLDVLDEHMDAIRALYPKEYTAVLRKIRG